jgi:hypothetical protein
MRGKGKRFSACGGREAPRAAAWALEVVRAKLRARSPALPGGGAGGALPRRGLGSGPYPASPGVKNPFSPPAASGLQREQGPAAAPGAPPSGCCGPVCVGFRLEMVGQG